ncbi:MULTISPECIES: hypothetical protein [unclassified Lentimicrobium]|uniref:hypothetical protein n=1 Tax=unclassified Lentimicrobium TaxID=2677434 RepID=UPI001551DCF0|nr:MULTISPECIES: hypothetical protein [unclassified Lentimicrobium]NPD47771.1 hypothetical protein [Lentimicrobium sp. S6]NPD86656.1 hypothetical protein [Lentimicrobium sp. L6]
MIPKLADFDYTKIIILLSIIIWVHLVHKEAEWEKDTVIQHDIKIYYSYLPATFIYKDLSFKFKHQLPKEITKYIWGKPLPNNEGYVQKMTMGTAIMYSPFFFIAHQHAKLFGYDPSGYSEPYSRWLVYSSIFYALMAMLIIRLTLIQFFSKGVVSLTLIILFFGTNLFFYTVYNGPMSHVYSFFLFSLFIYLSIKWNEKPHWGKAILIGLTGGLITLIRPTNIIIFIFPLLYNVYTIDTAKEKILILKKYWLHIFLIAISSIIMCSPQLIYWKYITGHWVYGSYGDEGFFFLNPNIIKGLFSYRKGWLIYTPLMIFAIIGIPFLFKKMKPFALPISIFLVLNIWIIYSWWTFWYGGGFGSRPMIDSYPLMAIPLALFISLSIKSKWFNWRIIPVIIAIVFFVRLNIFQTNQYNLGIIHYDGMTKEAYWGVWNKMHYPENYRTLIQRPDYESAKKGEKEDFDKN